MLKIKRACSRGSWYFADQYLRISRNRQHLAASDEHGNEHGCLLYKSPDLNPKSSVSAFPRTFHQRTSYFPYCENVIFAINLSKSLIANKKQENMYYDWLHTESLKLDMTGHQEAAQQLNW